MIHVCYISLYRFVLNWCQIIFFFSFGTEKKHFLGRVLITWPSCIYNMWSCFHTLSSWTSQKPSSHKDCCLKNLFRKRLINALVCRYFEGLHCKRTSRTGLVEGSHRNIFSLADSKYFHWHIAAYCGMGALRFLSFKHEEDISSAQAKTIRFLLLFENPLGYFPTLLVLVTPTVSCLL